jgi:DNA-binding response OmpR family regulator
MMGILSPDPMEDAAARSAQPLRSDQLPLRSVLVVDDDRIMRRTLELQLAPLGCRLLMAGSGQEALAMIKAHKPDLVLLDIVMPGIDGFEVCRELKQDLETQHIPILHLTSLGRDAKDRSFASGADDFIAKPPHFVELRARIRSHLLIRSLMEERAQAHASHLAWEEGRRARILVGEPQDTLREHIIDELRLSGHEAVGAPSIEACLPLLSTGVPDLLVLGQEQPDGQGHVFASHLRNFVRTSDLPVLLVCSRKTLREEITHVDVGPTDYLTKPFQPEELRVRVEVLLRQGGLARGLDAARSPAGRHMLHDPFTGAFTRSFLEAHLDLLGAGHGNLDLKLGLIAARFHVPVGGWEAERRNLHQAAEVLRAEQRPGEALCRVAEHTFVLVLPGHDAAGLEARMAHLTAAGFHGVLESIVPGEEGVPSLMRKLATLLQKAEAEHGQKVG